VKYVSKLQFTHEKRIANDYTQCSCIQSTSQFLRKRAASDSCTHSLLVPPQGTSRHATSLSQSLLEYIGSNTHSVSGYGGGVSLFTQATRQVGMATTLRESSWFSRSLPPWKEQPSSWRSPI